MRVSLFNHETGETLELGDLELPKKWSELDVVDVSIKRGERGRRIKAVIFAVDRSKNSGAKPQL